MQYYTNWKALCNGRLCVASWTYPLDSFEEIVDINCLNANWILKIFLLIKIAVMSENYSNTLQLNMLWLYTLLIFIFVIRFILRIRNSFKKCFHARVGSAHKLILWQIELFASNEAFGILRGHCCSSIYLSFLCRKGKGVVRLELRTVDLLI